MSSDNSADQRMHLAQAGGDRGGGASGDGTTLASSAGDKKRAATYMENHLLSDTKSAGAMADSGGQTVRPPSLAPNPPMANPHLKPDTGLKGLSGWATKDGLADAMTTWQGQVNKLMGQLQRELDALRGTKKLFQGQELDTQSQFNSLRPSSNLDHL